MLKSLCCLLVVLSFGCATSQPKAITRTLPAPVTTEELPPHPEDDIQVDPREDWAYAIEEGDVSEHSGIIISDGKARRAAAYVIRYKELRALYEIDMSTREREREIYEKHLGLAQEETDAWKERAKRSWWEQNKGTVGLVGGLVLGVVSAVAATMAIKKAAD